MFSSRIPLFSLLGFRVGVDASWFFLAFYLILSLSTRYFPADRPNLDQTLYYVMGTIGAFGLFASIILHELAHAVVARGFGLPIGGITLFIFGGVAELKQEPQTPRSEFWVAIAGPIASIVIAALCFAGQAVAAEAQAGIAESVLSFLKATNAVLAIFNLVPAFPLDGGRILRSIIWWQTGSLRRATRIASLCGTVFGIILIGFGILRIASGDSVGGTWQLLIGVFVTMAASQARKQTDSSDGLRDVTVSDFMDRLPMTAPADATVQQLVRDYLYRHSTQFIVIAEDGKAFGYVTPALIRKVPEADWGQTQARTVATSFTFDTAVSPTTPGIEAARKIQTNGVGYVAVLDGNRLLGVVSAGHIQNFLRVREVLAPRVGGVFPS